MEGFRIKVLLVDDESAAIDAAMAVLQGLSKRVDVTVANNQSDAISLLDEHFFDIAILDLRIPTRPGATDSDAAHGYAVFGHLLDSAPGTPVFLLTGSLVEEFATDLLSRGNRIDIWGTGVLPTVVLHRKVDIINLAGKLKPYFEGVAKISDIELDVDDRTISIEMDRLLRIFANQHRCVRCEARRVGGGLSGARIFRLAIFNEAGADVLHAVGKIGSIADVQDESERYNSYIARLSAGVTPRMLNSWKFGAKGTAANFYGLAAGHIYSFFDLSKGNGNVCGTAVENTANGLLAWRRASRECRKKVAEVRATLLSDERLREITETYNLDWVEEFEERNVQILWGCVHSDFHGENVLLTDQGVPQVIDYGDVAEGASCIDPVSLELSAFFHPNSPWRAHGWPSEGEAAHWGDLDVYLEKCPYPEFVRACRTWAVGISASRRGLAAAAYTYLIKQLKYEDADHQRALSLLVGVRRLWDENT